MAQAEDHSEQLPAHASPAFPPTLSPRPRAISDFQLADQERQRDPPASIISPAFTPPATPGTGTPALERPPKSVPVDTSLQDPADGPKLVQRLPTVTCEVRARIPTTSGQEMYLHLYKNDMDNKEHLAIVFGNQIRSRSLYAVRPGETQRDRLIRGAYEGRLHPGRVNEIKQDAVVVPPRAPPQEDATTNASNQIPLVRIHSECYTGETVWSARCDCGEQLDEAARLMSLPSNQPAGGVIIYLRQEGRGIGLGEKLKAYNLQDLGHDTYEANLLLRHPADARSYGLATAMLVDLGLKDVRLLTNNPDKVRAVEGPNREIRVRERVAMIPLAWQTGGQKGIKSEEVEKYLSTKIEKFKHMIG
ncbi:GTP cyclohydrolase II [Verruconis gallopava]|uniref:GTP cyclohydrolase II n=1 Tax=Verruconis gallopava TaxID=253628 RepID=A0A0D2AAK3_9PEZI|nr:GTP cyclohydrolase II [Verruconis gallopava]KIW03595.1 GTP cyclohydrolase II [Verruconis gallopava]